MNYPMNEHPSASKEDAPLGLWVRKGDFEHVYGNVKASANIKTKTTFLHLSCGCGAEEIELGMTLDVLKAVVAGLERAMTVLEQGVKSKGAANVH